MKFRNAIIVFFLMIVSRSFSQTSFKNIDTLLFKVFETVNQKDSLKYVSLVDQKSLLADKKNVSSRDSLMMIKPFYEAFGAFRESITDMANSPEFEIKYLEFFDPTKKISDLKYVGKILLRVKLVINDSFTVIVPFKLTVKEGVYSIEDPLVAMFLEN